VHRANIRLRLRFNLREIAHSFPQPIEFYDLQPGNWRQGRYQTCGGGARFRFGRPAAFPA